MTRIHVYRKATSTTWPWRWDCNHHRMHRVFTTHHDATHDAHLHAARHHA